MKTQQYLAALTIAMLSLLTSSVNTSSAWAADQSPASTLSAGAAEVKRLAESGLEDEVILTYIGQTQTSFSLSAADIVALKSAGVSSQAVTAMLRHDSTIHNQQAFASSALATPSVAGATTGEPTTGTAANTTTPPPSTTVVATSPPAPP